MGVPSRRSAPSTWMTGPASVSSTRSSFTHVSPMGFGRNGLRVANTPTRSAPPSRGGRTVGDQRVGLGEAVAGVSSSAFLITFFATALPSASCSFVVECGRMVLSSPRLSGVSSLAVSGAPAPLPPAALVRASPVTSVAPPPGSPFSKRQSSHRCEKLSIPATALFSAYSGSNTMRPCRCGARKLLRGMPNFCGKSVCM